MGETKITPILIISDGPSCPSGLGRICRDLATRIHEHMSDTFRVGVLGYGGPGSRKFGFAQYHIEGMKDDWVIPNLPEVCEDFFGSERGIVIFIWDASRVSWFSQPKIQCENARLRNFLMDSNFKRWIYVPVDSEGPNSRLTFPLKQALTGFDRVLAYGKWAAGVVDRTLDRPDGTTEYLPHGIDASIFYERNRALCRKMFVSITGACNLLGNQTERVKADEVLVGVVATNQSRKNWALGLEACAILAKTRNLRVWAKCDVLERSWSIPALLVDYGLVDKTMISLGDMNDDQMAQALSACDVTLGIGDGEGFGLPIFESLFCGTPAIHGNYGGAPEWMVNNDLLIDPIAYRYEGVYSCKRPVYSAHDWASRAESLLEARMNHNGSIDWKELWPHWEYWLKGGV